MATYYLDFENGNDVNDGTTFANRWKTLTNGATAARIAPGDTVRIMGSPAPTSLGQSAAWTSQALQAAKSITGATNATPISITCTAHGYSTGDTVVITGVGGNTNANGTWEITSTGANTFTLDGSAGNAAFTSGGTVRLRNNTRVMLTTAVTQNIASTGPGRSAWTSADAVNVTTSLNPNSSYFKEHSSSDQLSVGGGFSTGKAAYYTLPSTLNLSTYQQVSFYIQSLNVNTTAGQIEFRLCSDTLGDTAVDTISIPALVSGRWQPHTIDKGSALGSSINSIALYVITDLGSSTFNCCLSNVIACKASSAADSLTLTSLIGKNTTGETFWGIQSINGRRVMLDADTNAGPTSTSVRGYYGTSETVTTYKRETIKLGPATSSTTALQVIQDSGTEGNPITFSGGWDRTNMSTQTLETWLDGVNGNGYAIQSSQSYISLNTLAAVRFDRAYNTASTTNRDLNVSLVAVNSCTNGLVNIASNSNFTVSSAVANSNSGVVINNNNGRVTVNCVKGYSNGVYGINHGAAGDFPVLKGDFSNNGSGALRVYDGLLDGVSGADNASNTFAVFQNPASSVLTARNILPTGISAPFTFSDPTSNAVAYSHDHDQVSGNHKIFMSGALISAATDQRKTASGISWKIQPTSTSRTSSFPVTLSLAKVACIPNKLVTIKAWMRRDNTGLTMRLVCKGGQLAGVANDVVSSMTAAADTWQELTITFTPTVQGVVEVIAEAWGGSTFSGWVDDMTISQAV